MSDDKNSQSAETCIQKTEKEKTITHMDKKKKKKKKTMRS